MKYLAALFGIISGASLMAIQLRKNLPLFGSFLSPKMNEKLDKTDKRLAIISLISFIICLAFLVQTL